MPTLARRLLALGLAFLAAAPAAQASPAPVTAADLAGLPPPARRLMTAWQVVGQPRPQGLSLRFRGHFRAGLQHGWSPASASQTDTVQPIGRAFEIHMAGFGPLEVVARDTYEHGEGRLVARLAGLVPVAEGHGPDVDVSELVTWLAELACWAPAALVGHPAVAFRAVDDGCFDLTVRDGGHEATVCAMVDQRGALTAVSTDDRYLLDPDAPGQPARRTPWTTRLTAWTVGRPVPTTFTAAWELPGGRFEYVEMALAPG